MSVSTTAKKTASAGVAAVPPAPDPMLPLRFGVVLVAFGLAAVIWNRRRGSRALSPLPLGVLILFSLAALSCGGRTPSQPTPAVIDPGTPAGTYTVTLTATDSTGTVSVSTPLTLTVQNAAN